MAVDEESEDVRQIRRKDDDRDADEHDAQPERSRGKRQGTERFALERCAHANLESVFENVAS